MKVIMFELNIEKKTTIFKEAIKVGNSLITFMIMPLLRFWI